MIKTDMHMEKVKGKLLGEKERLDEREEKRKQRDHKKVRCGGAFLLLLPHTTSQPAHPRHPRAAVGLAASEWK